MRVNGADYPQVVGYDASLTIENGLCGAICMSWKSLVSLLFFSFSSGFAVLSQFSSQCPFLLKLHVR